MFVLADLIVSPVLLAKLWNFSEILNLVKSGFERLEA